MNNPHRPSHPQCNTTSGYPVESTPQTISEDSLNTSNYRGHTHEIEHASTKQAGIVKLNDTLTSEAVNEALTAAKGKELAKRIQELTQESQNEQINHRLEAALDYLSTRYNAAYPTYARALSRVPVLPNNALVYVVNDPDETKNGLYYVDALSLIKAPFDALSSAFTTDAMRIFQSIMTEAPYTEYMYNGVGTYSVSTIKAAVEEFKIEKEEKYLEMFDRADAGIDVLIRNGMVRGFETEVLLKQWQPPYSGARAKADDTKQVWRWELTSVEGTLPVTGVWINTGPSELDLAKDYADQLITQIPKPLQVEILTGEQLYNRAKDNPTQIFNAIWQEYSKPVYHIGNGTFVDVTGVTIVPYVVIPELVFKVKLTTDNETFIFPTRNSTALPIDMQIDWGDGTSSNHSSQIVSHAYSGVAGDEFTVRVTGSAIPYFDFSPNNAARRTSRLMVNSIEKNTLPARSMEFFSISGCDNIKYIGSEAFQSFSGTTLSLGLASYENVTFHKDAFKGLGHVTSIDNLFGGVTSNGLYTLPVGLLDYFINVTSAVGLFRNLNSVLPDGILDKMVNLEDVTMMFYTAKVTAINNRIFKNQTKLKNVTQVFRLSSTLVADAYILYTDMNQGSPTTVNGCFANVPAMTNLASVPATWKAL